MSEVFRDDWEIEILEVRKDKDERDSGIHELRSGIGISWEKWNREQKKTVKARHVQLPVVAIYEVSKASEGVDSDHYHESESYELLTLKTLIINNNEIQIKDIAEKFIALDNYALILEMHIDSYTDFYSYIKESKSIIEIIELQNAKKIAEIPIRVLYSDVTRKSVDSSVKHDEKYILLKKIDNNKTAVARVREYYYCYDETLKFQNYVYEDEEGNVVEYTPEIESEEESIKVYKF